MPDSVTDERNEDWNSHRKLVISTLKSLADSVKELENDMRKEFEKMRDRSPENALRQEIRALEIELVQLKTKVGFIGGISGIVAGALATVVLRSFGAN